MATQIEDLRVRHEVNPAGYTFQSYADLGRDPVTDVEMFYSDSYRVGKTDVPDESRVALRKRAEADIRSLETDGIVVEVGSGPQLFWMDYVSANGKPSCKVHTVDIAHIDPQSLKGKAYPQITHHRADIASLPFLQNESVDIVISNMSLELAPEAAYYEMNRIMKNGGRAYLQWYKTERSVAYVDSPDHRLTPYERKKKAFWSRYLQSGINPVLGQDVQTVREAFRRYGFLVTRFEDPIDRLGKPELWYSIDLMKVDVPRSQDVATFPAD